MAFSPNLHKLRIAVVGKSSYFLAYRAGLVAAIKNFGFDAEEMEALPSSAEIFDCVLIINPHQYKLEARKFAHQSVIYAAIQTEQMPTDNVGADIFAYPRFQELLNVSRSYDYIFEWSIESLKMLRKFIPQVRYFPHSSFDEILTPEFRDHTQDAPYDILFIGEQTGIKNRREEILTFLGSKYKLYPVSKEIWGKEKLEAIKQSKIFLNIHFDNAFTFENPRLYDALSSGAFVLSEKIYNSYPLKSGKHFASFYLHNIDTVIDHYLAHPEERVKIAQAGYNRMKQLHMNKTIGTLLQYIIIEKLKRQSKKYALKRWLWHKIGIFI